MEDIKAYLIQFAEGKVNVPEFLEHCEKYPEVLNYLTQISDPEFKTYVTHKRTGENGFPQYYSEELPFNAKLCIEEEMKRKGHGRLGHYLNLHSLFSQVIVKACPNDHIIVDQTLDNKFGFMLDACPEYIGGPEVDELLENLLETLPEDLSKSKKIRLYREKVKELFHIEQNKYPRWVQEAEWPVGEDGIPMKFISQKRKKGKAYETMLYTEFLFKDVKTGEQRTVEQFT